MFKTTAKLSEKSIVPIVFNGVLYLTMPELILLPFLIITLHESGTRKAIFWSVTVYNKNLSSQCSNRTSTR